ncbi:MAG: hypothetical protein WBP64_16480 [Nitrososphaeraceae archaeon]
MAKLETWLSFACLGLCAMYVALLLSFYNFLIGPNGNGPNTVVDPTAIIVQIVSISGAPALVLCGIVFAMTKGSRNKNAGLILLAAGIILISGIVSLKSVVTKIPERMMISNFEPLNYVFLIAGIAVILIGIYQFLSARDKRKNRISLK